MIDKKDLINRIKKRVPQGLNTGLGTTFIVEAIAEELLPLINLVARLEQRLKCPVCGSVDNVHCLSITEVSE